MKPMNRSRGGLRGRVPRRAAETVGWALLPVRNEEPGKSLRSTGMFALAARLGNCFKNRIVAWSSRLRGWFLKQFLSTPPAIGCLILPILVAGGALHGPNAACGAGPAEAAWQKKMSNMQLLMFFQPKGSSLPYDIGVASEVYQQVAVLRQQRVIVGGSSSGSILAAYFACFGFTDASMRYAEYQLRKIDRTAVRDMEDPSSKISKYLRGQRTEIPHFTLREYVAFALGVPEWQAANSLEEIVARGRVGPSYPVLIVAANKEVLDNRGTGGLLEGQDYKEFDPRDFSVSWKPDVYEFYRRHPERFAREHPDLRLGPDRRIGKVATYFVDRSMFELLRRIPADQRLADLRLMDSPEDVALAIKASVSEPTYFDPVEDPLPGKLMVGDRMRDLGCSRRRLYCGGFIMPLAAQDVRRMLPGIRVLGSGWTHNPLSVRQFLRSRYLVDVEQIAQLNCWWADTEMNPSRAFQEHFVAHDLPAEQEFETGRARARDCLKQDRCLPMYVARTEHNVAAADRLLPQQTDGKAAGSQNGDANSPLATLRGLGSLLPHSQRSGDDR